jgi:hypothetical protein
VNGINHTSAGAGTTNILFKKKKGGKKGGAYTGGHSQVRTPMDFESSMSSNSALVMMDGGTGSEHINFKQQ